MTKSRKKIHLICNAHLDPVWLWRWEEGAGEALSTFRTAVELCEKNDGFIFNHNEVIIYEWVREYEPALFKRIQKLVKMGRWHIMGGWFLQPDCNMPSGESFVRQILTGRNYFKEHFGVEPKTAINFDPFGHTRGLVQILAKSGYDSYMFMRPDDGFMKLPKEDFIWKGFDGSVILAHRFSFGYNSIMGKAREKIERWMQEHQDDELFVIPWGVGNHGGGPSRYDIAQVNKLIRQKKDVEIVHSTPEAYFKDVAKKRQKLPVRSLDLNPWAPGCYTSMSMLKQRHRQLENELYMAEKMACAAYVQGFTAYPKDNFAEALRDLMFGEFHDILPGSCIEEAERDSLRLLDHGLEIVSREKAKMFFALASGQKKPKDGIVPILVYNPHPYPVKKVIECEFMLGSSPHGGFTNLKVTHEGEEIDCQVEKESSNIQQEWRKRVVFETELAPGQMNRFDCEAMHTIKEKPKPRLKAKNGRIVFKSDELNIVVNTRTGLIDRYKVNGVDYISQRAFEPICMADDEDSWGMRVTCYNAIAGKFKLVSARRAAELAGLRKKSLEPVRVIEDGSVRSVVEAIFEYGDSFICQRYFLPKFGTEIEIETRVHWFEKNRLLKLAVPLKQNGYSYRGQVAYGMADLPSDGTEVVAQKWTAAFSRKHNAMVSIINNGVYGSDFIDDTIRLSLLRGPVYSGPPIDEELQIKQDRYIPRTDQGLRIFKFWLNAGGVSQRMSVIDREALAKNEEPFALAYFPSGEGKKPKQLALLSDKAVQITAIKKADKNDDLIIRLFEPTGRKRTTILSLPFARKKIKVELGKFEIRTLRFSIRSGKFAETDLIEKPLRNKK